MLHLAIPSPLAPSPLSCLSCPFPYTLPASRSQPRISQLTQEGDVPRTPVWVQPYSYLTPCQMGDNPLGRSCKTDKNSNRASCVESALLSLLCSSLQTEKGDGSALEYTSFIHSLPIISDSSQLANEVNIVLFTDGQPRLRERGCPCSGGTAWKRQSWDSMQGLSRFPWH